MEDYSANSMIPVDTTQGAVSETASKPSAMKSCCSWMFKSDEADKISLTQGICIFFSNTQGFLRMKANRDELTGAEGDDSVYDNIGITVKEWEEEEGYQVTVNSAVIDDPGISVTIGAGESAIFFMYKPKSQQAADTVGKDSRVFRGLTIKSGTDDKLNLFGLYNRKTGPSTEKAKSEVGV